jgi:hypothetical protein
MAREDVGELLLETMRFGQHTLVTDRGVGALLSSRVEREEKIGGGAWHQREVVDPLERPLWARWLRWVVPPFLRPVTVFHYHVCPHVGVPASDGVHLEWMSQGVEVKDDQRAG